MVIMINNNKITIPLKRGRLKIILKPQLLTVVLRKIVKSQSVTVGLRIFLKLLKPRSPTVVFYTLKKIHVDTYMNTKDYFDKY